MKDRLSTLGSGWFRGLRLRLDPDCVDCSQDAAASLTRRSSQAALAAALVVIASTACAQAAYPTRPIRLIVPFPAGGATDILARIVAARLSKTLAQQVIVDNRAAASGIVGTEIVARAAPDGYTLLLGSSSTLAINTVTFSKLPYDPMRDFSPVTMVGVLPWLIVVKPSLPSQTVSEFVALAKAKPGSLLYASSSSAAELAAEWFSRAAGIKMTAVPYKGMADAVRDFLGGQLDLIVNPIATAYPLVKNKKARALAVTTAQRSTLAPEIPTVAEQGIAGFDVAVWHCLMLPARAPQALVARLNQEIGKILSAADVGERFAQQGTEARTSTPAELGHHLKTEVARWQKVAREAGIKPSN